MPFTRDAARSLQPDAASNYLVHGEALAVMRELPMRFESNFRLLYADPPYNTGYDWKQFNDRKRVEEWEAHLEAIFRASNRVLTADATVWVSIDDRAVHHMRALLDRVYGPRSFVASCVWQKRTTRENRGAIGDAHEYVLIYARDPEAFAKRRNMLEPNDKLRGQYKNPNNDPKGPWQTISLVAQLEKSGPNQHYEIVAPNGKRHVPPAGGCWSLTRENYDELVRQDRIRFGSNGNGVPRKLRYLSEVEGLVPWTWWPADEVGTTAEAKREQYELFGRGEGAATPKPERLLERIVKIASNPGDGVLELFAGSGTGAAVAHKLGRSWMAVDDSDAIDYARRRMTAVCTRTSPVGVPYANPRLDGFKYLTHVLPTG